jgi:nucleoid-associated protein YgaU
MQSDIKIGIIVGIVVVVAAAVLFVSQGKDQGKPELEVTPPPQTEQSAPVVQTPATTEPVVVEPKLQPKPEVETKAPEATGSVVVTPPPPAETKEPVVPPAPAAPEPEVRLPRYHTVVTGDSLYVISEQYYGTGKFANSIFEANRTLIKNADVLQLGWKLRIPYPDEIEKK